MLRFATSTSKFSRGRFLLLLYQHNQHQKVLASTSTLQTFQKSLKDYLRFFDGYLLARRAPPRKIQKRHDKKRDDATPKGDHPVYDSLGKDMRASSSGDSDGPSGNDEDEMFKKLISMAKRVFAISLFAYGIVYMLSPPSPENVQETLSWSEFVNEILPTGQVYRIIVNPELDVATVFLYDTGLQNSHGKTFAPRYRIGIPSVSRFETEVRAAEAALGLPPDQWTQIQYRRMDSSRQWLVLGFFALVIYGLFMAFRKVRGSINMSDLMSSMTKFKYTIIDPHGPEGKKLMKVKFKDVAGLHEAKTEIREFVDYLKNSSRFTRLGARIPKGALLTGPPGCGKTLLAKALAAESVVPFISMNGSEFVEVIGGLGASRIRSLFKDARSRAPCIIYIDEIDAIGRKRSEGDKSMAGGSGEEEQTLNQLLVEMDGMGSDNGVIVLASTNRADVLDKALLRPGRFDRHILIDLPTLIERKEMFELYLRNVKLDHSPSQYSHKLAQMTPGFSGADIMNVVNEAAIHAASNKTPMVTLKDLNFALDRILAGPEKRSRTLVEEEREVVAYHEAGHALVGWLLEHTDALLKVTIIPRTSAALGFAQYCPKDKKLFTREELFDRMCMMLGGRAAESLKFGRITTGAQDDLQKVTKTAYAQVKLYGMSATVGALSFPNTDGFQIKPYSKKFGFVMDQEANLIVSEAYTATVNLLRSNVDKLETLAQALLKREVLQYDDVKQLLGKPKYGDKHVVDLVDNVLPKEETLGI